MGILKFLFGSKGKEEEEETTYEVVEQRIPVEECKHEVRIKYPGGEAYVGDFFLTSKDLAFSRFYLPGEKPPKPHFAPSLEQAISWFRGENLPKDGSGSVFWGRDKKFQCQFCDFLKHFPIRLSRMECLVIYKEIPEYQEIAGWRVGQVESELLGKGIPTKYIELNKTHAIIKWESRKKQFVCQRCAERLKELGRQAELLDYVIFPTD
jgi:hypothetical protein